MPGIATEGKLFFNFFLKDLAGAGGAASAERKQRNEQARWKSGVYRLRRPRLRACPSRG
jgi:hypothetical protein